MTNGETVILKKPHACGNNEWKIIRSGAIVKLQCYGCDRIVEMTVTEYKKRVKTVVSDNKTHGDDE